MSPLPLGILASSGAGAAPGMELIGSYTVSSAVTAFTIGPIPNTYRHLQIRGTLKSTGGATDLLFRINDNLSTSIYKMSTIQFQPSSVSSTYSGVDSQLGFYDAVSDSSITNRYGGFIMDIMNYASTSKRKTVNMFYAAHKSTSVPLMHMSSGLIDTTAAIYNVRFSLPNNFTVGSSVQVYGVSG